MPDKDIDIRVVLFNKHSDILYDSCGDSNSCLLIDDAKMAMDEYFTERAYELLEYMAKNYVKCGYTGDGSYFNFKGQPLTKEQLFENFL